jgi:hypothetical protein
MILVILHTAERTEYDHNWNVVEEKGTVSVSHGVDCETGKTVILPCERWSNFRHRCVQYEGEWYIR